MRSYAEQNGLLCLDDVVLLKRIRQVVEVLPEIELVSSHLLARAIAKFFPVRVVDGHFGDPDNPHSWLVTERGNIIDVYPIAQVGGPVLLDASSASPWRLLFVKHEIPDLVDKDFVCHLLKVQHAVGNVMKWLKFVPLPKDSYM